MIETTLLALLIAGGAVQDPPPPPPEGFEESLVYWDVRPMAFPPTSFEGSAEIGLDCAVRRDRRLRDCRVVYQTTNRRDVARWAVSAGQAGRLGEGEWPERVRFRLVLHTDPI